MKGNFGFLIPGKKRKKIVVEVELTDEVILIFNRGAAARRNNGAGSSSLNKKPEEEASIVIKLSEVIGCHRMRGNSPGDTSAYFAVFSYPLVRTGGLLKSELSRTRHVHTLEVSHKATYDENSQEAVMWMEEIRKRLKTPIPPHRGWNCVPIQKQRCLYVLVNPQGGPGKALEMFQDQVVPVLAEANTVCKLVITERANHAKDLAQQLDLKLWDGVVTVSGDGLVFEVLNGFMLREDREQALRMPLGIIPAGSGNALATAICYTCGESILSDFATQHAVMIARPRYLPMKLVHVETDKEHLACFIGVAWGLISDVDIESEKYRKTLGGARFVYYSLVRLARLRTYRGRISFLRYEGSCPSLKDASTSPPRLNSPISDADGTVKRENVGQEGHGRMSRESCHEKAENAGFSYVIMADENKGASNSRVNCSSVQSAEEYARQREFWKRKHVVENVPPLSEPVPEHWSVIEDDFIFVCGVFMSHLSEDIMYMPKSKLDDGLIYLTFVRAAGVGRSQLVKILTGFATGDHVKHDCFEVVPVRCFRLEQIGERKGILTVDGEQVEASRLQLSLTSYKTYVMGR